MRPTWLIAGRVAASGWVDPCEAPELDRAGIRAVLSLTEDNPFVDGPPEGIRHLHVPIPDMSAPEPDDLERAVDFVREEYHGGRPVLVHCLAGLGRTGTVLACFLVAEGRSAGEAIAEVRAARPGSLEVPEQEDCVRAFRPREGGHG